MVIAADNKVKWSPSRMEVAQAEINNNDYRIWWEFGEGYIGGGLGWSGMIVAGRYQLLRNGVSLGFFHELNRAKKAAERDAFPPPKPTGLARLWPFGGSK